MTKDVATRTIVGLIRWRTLAIIEDGVTKVLRPLMGRERDRWVVTGSHGRMEGGRKERLPTLGVTDIRLWLFLLVIRWVYSKARHQNHDFFF